MSAKTYSTDLAAKVGSILRDETDDLLEGAANGPLGDLTSEQLDARDWGVAYGVAIGIARGEDPYESFSSVIAVPAKPRPRRTQRGRACRHDRHDDGRP
jgi:hypothetical protein